MSESRTIRKHSIRLLYYPPRRGYLQLSDIYDWVNTFMKAAFASDLSAFPLPEHPLATEDGAVPIL